MNELQILNNAEFGELRTIEENKKILFCGSDVAKALEYARPNDAITAHCRYTVKRSIPHPQAPDKQIEMLFIPEGDVYRLICHSKIESAERFEKWVFDEVLPTIRKHGAYITIEAAEKIMSDPDNWIKLLTALKEEREGKEVAEAKCATLESDNYQLADTVDKLDKQVMKLTQSRDRYEKLYKEYRIKNYFTDICIDKGENLCIRDTAKELGVKETELVKLLIERKYLYRRKQKQNRLFPYSSPQCAGMFVVKEVIFGRGLTYQTQTLVTPAGRAKLTAECARAGLLPMAIENPAFEWEVAR